MLNRLDKPMTVLTVSFLAQAVVSGSLLVTLFSMPEPTEDAVTFLVICVGLSAVAGIAFYISIGILASRLGKSWIIWAGLPFITKPVGWIFAYFMMRRRVLEARTTTTINPRVAEPPAAPSKWANKP